MNKKNYGVKAYGLVPVVKLPTQDESTTSIFQVKEGY